MDWRSDSTKFIVLVTDASYKNDNNYGISDMNEMIRLLEKDGIIVSVISSNDSYYSSLVENTGGLYGSIKGNFSSILLGLADKIGEVTNDGEWVFLSDYQAVKLAPEEPGKTRDTDGDGVPDSDELGEKEEQSLTPLIAALLHSYGIPEEYYMGKEAIDVYHYRSNPVLADTDYDGYLDKEDANPKKWDISDRDLAICANIAYSDPEVGTRVDESSIELEEGASVKEMKGWVVVGTSEYKGFYAMALKKDDNIIIAYRGSKDLKGSKDEDWWDDWFGTNLRTILTGMGSQTLQSQYFAEQVATSFPGYNFYICGHSLGGNLAINASIPLLNNNSSIVKKVSTYNGLGIPGMKLATRLFTHDDDISTLKNYSYVFLDYEIEGDPVSWLECKDGNFFDILGITSGVGYRPDPLPCVVYNEKGKPDEHNLGNFHKQLPPRSRIQSSYSGGGGGAW